MTTESGRVTGSRASAEPSSTVSALSGFDPARDALQWLFERGHINNAQLGAARRLQNRSEQHLDRFWADMDVMGPGLSDIVYQVVIRGEGMRDAERALGWPPRTGKLVLSIALTRLAGHYAAIATEARRAETTGSACEGAGPQGHRPENSVGEKLP